MQTVYKSIKLILILVIIMLAIQTIFGSKASEKMGIVILLSMLIYQSDNVSGWITGLSNNLTNNIDDGKSTIHTGAGNRVSGGGSKKF